MKLEGMSLALSTAGVSSTAIHHSRYVVVSFVVEGSFLT